MHLRSVEVLDFGPIRRLRWALAGETAGWHVFIGDNGAGKSSLLRALSLAMVGRDGVSGLRVRAKDFVRQGAARGEVRVVRSDDEVREYWTDDTEFPGMFYFGEGTFHAAFGPSRRFSGDGGKAARLRAAYPEVARHLSLFDDEWALTEVASWLKDLQLDERQAATPVPSIAWIGSFLDHSDLLPDRVRFHDVTSIGPRFRDAAGTVVGLEALSDGYQSVLGLALELIRQLATFAGPSARSEDLLRTPGVVLIDEIDAHLHPTWQQRIGRFFVAQFPAMQFLVTTHSPLVCRAAEHGSIFRLPHPGEPEDEGALVTGENRDRLIFGDVLDAYGTGVFGAGVARSEQGRLKLERLAELNVRARFGQRLSEEEKVEQRSLQAIFTQSPRSPGDL